MYLTLVFLPFMGSILSLGFGRWLGKKGGALVTIISLLSCAVLSMLAFYEIGLGNLVCELKLIVWFNSGLVFNSWGFLFDSLTVTMLIVVTGISSLVHIYSTEYMQDDPHLPRFMSYLSLFTFFMLILVTADNFLQMFVGWEGVGLCSYLLINFWFTRLQANKSAIKAMLINRIGDFGLALGIFTIYLNFNSVDYGVVFGALQSSLSFETKLFYDFTSLDLITFFLFIGAVGKSAQLGLHMWLPDAMEGPTPVSALIHAATMVTAGVFLIARTSILFEQCPGVLEIVTLVGAMTAFFAATTGLVQNDLKRVIAYSTCSQLGYMVLACGVSGYTAGVFHLANHAFFKALLFLSAGAIIHALQDEQDMRRMGGLRRVLPFTFAMVMIGSLSLFGFPFLSGFYSKDAILELAFARYNIVGQYAYLLGSFAAFCTAFYSLRLIVLVFLTDTNGHKGVIESSHENSHAINISLAILAVPSIVFGFLTKDMMIGLGSDFWGSAVFVGTSTAVEAEFLPHTVKLFPTILGLTGAALSYYLYIYQPSLLYGWKTGSLREIYVFLNRKWFFDRMGSGVVGPFFLKRGYVSTFKLLDKGLFEQMGPWGVYYLINFGSKTLSQLQNGRIHNYTMFFVFSFTIFFFIQYIGISVVFLVKIAPLFLFALSTKFDEFF